jgi:hypothetical protein
MLNPPIQTGRPLRHNGHLLSQIKTQIMICLTNNLLINLFNKTKVMYNIHQYTQSVRIQQQLQEDEQRYAKYLLKHEGKGFCHADYKEKAKEKMKERASAFLHEVKIVLDSKTKNLNLLSSRMIISQPGGVTNNTEISKIAQNLSHSRASDINHTMKWTKSSTNANANK